MKLFAEFVLPTAVFEPLILRSSASPVDVPDDASKFIGRIGEGETVIKNSDLEGTSAYTDPGSGQPSGSGVESDGTVHRQFIFRRPRSFW